MVRLTLTAGRQFEVLFDHCIALDRSEAVDRLVAALRDALARIEADPASGKPHPASHRDAARWGYRWIKVHRYWFGHSSHRGQPVITNVLFETADIPGRIAAEDDDLMDLP